MNTPLTADPEFAAIQAVFAALDPLDDDARVRVVTYIAARLDIELKAPSKPAPVGNVFEGLDEVGDGPGVAAAASGGGPPLLSYSGAPTFGDFAELYDAASPKSHAEKVLAAGYWLQVCEHAESFDSQSANTLLKHLGHGIPNVTKAIDGLKAQSPALALQLKKSGTSQQARKTYKITVAGIREIEKMIMAG